MPSAPPRTLIVSWHWPPTNRASAGVLGALFGSAPPGMFRVVTRSFPDYPVADRRESGEELETRVPASYVPWPLDDQSQPTLRTLPAVARTVAAMTGAACRVGRAWNAQRVLAVYPHRLSLLAGWLSARRLGIPLVLYMHDLLAEGMTMKNPLRRVFWRLVDSVCLNRAWLVIVPTEEFARHYRMRGVARCWVLPHCVGRKEEEGTKLRATEEGARSRHEGTKGEGELHLVYSGAIYEPHAGAAEAFVAATRSLEKVRVTFLTDPRACGGLLGRAGAQWLPYAEAMNELVAADVCVVLLGTNTSCPDEVQGCFPSKLVDYLSAGRPILAVVPKGCFVDRLVSQSGCGAVVHRHDRASIRAAIVLLHSAEVRSRMAGAARRLARELNSEDWMGGLLERLRVGPRRLKPAARSSASHVGIRADAAA